jgi:hypothetical protein
VNPAEQTELLLKIPLFQRHNEAHEANGVQSETDHAVIGNKRKEIRVGKNNMLDGKNW